MSLPSGFLFNKFVVPVVGSRLVKLNEADKNFLFVNGITLFRGSRELTPQGTKELKSWWKTFIVNPVIVASASHSASEFVEMASLFGVNQLLVNRIMHHFDGSVAAVTVAESMLKGSMEEIPFLEQSGLAIADGEHIRLTALGAGYLIGCIKALGVADSVEIETALRKTLSVAHSGYSYETQQIGFLLKKLDNAAQNDATRSLKSNFDKLIEAGLLHSEYGEIFFSASGWNVVKHASTDREIREMLLAELDHLSSTVQQSDVPMRQKTSIPPHISADELDALSSIEVAYLMLAEYVELYEVGDDGKTRVVTLTFNCIDINSLLFNAWMEIRNNNVGWVELVKKIVEVSETEYRKLFSDTNHVSADGTEWSKVADSLLSEFADKSPVPTSAASEKIEEVLSLVLRRLNKRN